MNLARLVLISLPAPLTLSRLAPLFAERAGRVSSKGAGRVRERRAGSEQREGRRATARGVYIGRGGGQGDCRQELRVTVGSRHKTEADERE